MNKLLIAGTLVLSLSACDQPATFPDHSDATTVDNPLAVVGNVSVNLQSEDNSAGDAAQVAARRRVEAAMAGHAAVARALRGVSDPQTADRLISETTGALTGDVKDAAAQIGSVTMLKAFDLSYEEDAELAIAVRHVRHLAESGNGDLDLIATTLEKLSGELDANATAGIAQRALDSQPTLSTSHGRRGAPPSAVREDAAAGEAVARLRALASGE